MKSAKDTQFQEAQMRHIADISNPPDFIIPKDGIKLYIHRRGFDLRRLKDAQQSKDAFEFFRVGHGLKGNAINYGFPELEILGNKLEEISRSNNWNFAQELVCEFESWYQQKLEEELS